MSFFGKNIRKIRSIKKISQTEFAKIFDISRASIGSYEEGRAEPKIEIISNVAKYFSITIDELINKELTVNDLYHFDVGSEPVFKIDQSKIPQLIKIPLYSTNTIDQINRPENAPTKESIKIPVLNPSTKMASLVIQTKHLSFVPNIFNDNDTIILDVESEITENKHFHLIKYNNAIHISKLIFLANQKICLSDITSDIFIIDRNEIQVCYPIIQHITNNLIIDPDQKTIQLEIKMQQLIKKLYQ